MIEVHQKSTRLTQNCVAANQRQTLDVADIAEWQPINGTNDGQSYPAANSFIKSIDTTQFSRDTYNNFIRISYKKMWIEIERNDDLEF